MDKFLFVLPTDRLGGAERVAMNLVRYLSSAYTKTIIYVVFMSRGDSGGWNDLKNISNIKLIYNNFKSEKSSFPHLVYYLVKGMNNVDFVYSTHTHVNSLMSFLRKLHLLNNRYLVLRESTIISQRFSGLKKLVFDVLYKFYGAQDLLICQTDLMRDEFLKARGDAIAGNIKTIPNPLDIQHINFVLENNNLDVVHDNGFVIVMVGRLVEVKNHALVIKSLAKLNQENVGRFKLIIIGSGVLETEIYQLVNACGLADQVNFLGNVKDPYHHMNSADLGIISSISEGFPNVLIEMMASGIKNLVMTPCTGDLDKLPCVTVTSDHNIDTMATTILQAINTPKNYSNIYIQYAQSRDIPYYWNEIIKNIGYNE